MRSSGLFLVRWPARVKAGTTSDHLACLTDVVATVTAVTGAELPHDATEDSFERLAALDGRMTEPIRPYLLSRAFGGERTLSIRRGSWKYLNHRGLGGNSYDTPTLKPFAVPEAEPDATGQLYNLANDPGETTNLDRRHPDIAAELKQLLDSSRSTGRSRP